MSPQNDETPPMTIEAEVREYVRNAMRDDFGGGQFASYDATRLHLTSPEAVKGRDVPIYHDAPVPEDSPWRRTGHSVRFEIDPELLEGGTQVFAGAVSGLHPVPGGGG